MSQDSKLDQCDHIMVWVKNPRRFEWIKVGYLEGATLKGPQLATEGKFIEVSGWEDTHELDELYQELVRRTLRDLKEGRRVFGRLERVFYGPLDKGLRESPKRQEIEQQHAAAAAAAASRRGPRYVRQPPSRRRQRGGRR